MFKQIHLGIRFLVLPIILAAAQAPTAATVFAEPMIESSEQAESLLVGMGSPESASVGSVFDVGDLAVGPAVPAGLSSLHIRSGSRIAAPKSGDLLAVAAGTALLMSTDESTQRWINRKMPPEDGETDLARAFGFLSSDLFTVALSSALIYTGDASQRDTGRLLLSSSFQTAVTVGVAKLVFGRERPEDSGGQTRFHPFCIGDFSFPSFDAANAFSMATILGSRDTRNRSLYYGVATALALLRVVRNKHFASDVFVGAALGTGIARSNLAGQPLFLGSAFDF